MLRRYALAPLRGLVLFGLSIVGFAQAGVALVISFAGLVHHFELERWLPNLVRRMSHSWFGVVIPRPYRPVPALPKPERDGRYKIGNQLYRRERTVVRMQRYEWLLKDPATHRDHLWALLTPVTGGLAAALPAALVASVFVLPILVGVPLAVAGLAIGPAMLRVYGQWTGSLLGPSGRTGRGRFWSWVIEGVFTQLKLAATFGLALCGLPLALVVAGSVFPGILGPLQLASRPVRQFVNTRRRQIAAWSGVTIPEPYLPPPPPPSPRPDGKYLHGCMLYDSPTVIINSQNTMALVRDQATWRDLLWLVLDPLVAFVLAGLPVLLAVFGFVVYFASWVWSLPVAIFTDFDLRQGWAYVSDHIPGLEGEGPWLTPVAGLVAAMLALLASRPLLRAHGQWSKLLLSPTRSVELARRVDHLTESRTDATDTQAAELRRIERDLHDGAQARWVAMGLNLGAVERLMDQNPEAAKKLLANARDASAEALVELRRLVRGIMPPVLTERGLGDAVRALALDSTLNVTVVVELPGSLEAPVEAAVYFAISELLTNVAKHARAERVSVDIRHVHGKLRVTVADDGQGGADPVGGSGLRGLQRRLATFDGVLTLTSPLGGPTTATLEVPCALSSPRTSTSSETA
ncbi:MAG: histidine kinase [Kibdelosporangium sp.]